jgi:hypothetical protein
MYEIDEAIRAVMDGGDLLRFLDSDNVVVVGYVLEL